MIGYVSFFFKIDNFTDRAMVVLTTMLVIATMTSSIESVITKLNLGISCFVSHLKNYKKPLPKVKLAITGKIMFTFIVL